MGGGAVFRRVRVGLPGGSSRRTREAERTSAPTGFSVHFGREKPLPDRSLMRMAQNRLSQEELYHENGEGGDR